eukprot:scaffold2726_cov67-Isochrysis_galbana.AAC.1
MLRARRRRTSHLKISSASTAGERNADRSDVETAASTIRARWLVAAPAKPSNGTCLTWPWGSPPG